MSSTGDVEYRGCRVPGMSSTVDVEYRGCRVPWMSSTVDVEYRGCRVPSCRVEGGYDKVPSFPSVQSFPSQCEFPDGTFPCPPHDIAMSVSGTTSLELFSGTASFTKGVRRFYTDSTCSTVDWEESDFYGVHPSLRTDIRTWNYPDVLRGARIDVLWASPPCTEYSKAKTRQARDFESADALVARALEIIAFVNPRVWILENPASGRLPRRFNDIFDSVRGVKEVLGERGPGWEEYRVHYCAYGAPYKKNTSLWSNVDLSDLRQCAGPGVCPTMIHRGRRQWQHTHSVGNGRDERQPGKKVKAYEKGSIPEALIDHLVRIVDRRLRAACTIVDRTPVLYWTLRDCVSSTSSGSSSDTSI